nr:urease accessory protein UreD [Jannaschia aquimarina]
MQRARGAARVEIGRAGLRDLSQSGCAKAMLPRVDGPDPEVVFLNTSGGVTGGDILAYECKIGADARVTASTQTAERTYRAASGEGRIDVRLTVGAGARLDWLPQETILFEGSATRRDTVVDLAEDATVLLVESAILGRAAMGERTQAATLSDRRTIRRAGRLIHEEHFHLDPEALAHPHALAGAQAVASLILIGPGAEDAHSRLRDLPDFAAASAWDGRLVVRMAHATAAPLRRALIGAIVALRGAPMPRVWQAER